MRFLTSVSLLGAMLALTISCGGVGQSHQTGASARTDQGPAEDSGKRLAGEFMLVGIENAYQPKQAQVPAEAVWTFDEQGNFKRRDKSHSEEGAYLIGTGGELLIYIEKINGDLLGAARTERYAIAEKSDDTLIVVGASQKFLLRKR